MLSAILNHTHTHFGASLESGYHGASQEGIEVGRRLPEYKTFTLVLSVFPALCVHSLF